MQMKHDATCNALPHNHNAWSRADDVSLADQLNHIGPTEILAQGATLKNPRDVIALVIRKYMKGCSWRKRGANLAQTRWSAAHNIEWSRAT